MDQMPDETFNIPSRRTMPPRNLRGLMRPSTTSSASTVSFTTDETEDATLPPRCWNMPKCCLRAAHYCSCVDDRESHQVNIKKEEDLVEDARMTSPSPATSETIYGRQSTESSSLPSSNGTSSLFSEREGFFNDDYHSRNREAPRVSEVRDEDQMSIERESNSRAYGNDEDSREREREDSVSTVITIRNHPLSPLADRGCHYGTEEADYDLVRTAEYQRAVFEMLEDWCTDAARKAWRSAATQTRHCIPKIGPGLFSQRDRRRHQSRMSRSRVDPYPSPRGDFTLPHHYPTHSHVYDIYGLHSDRRDEDTRMSLSPPASFTEDLRNHQPVGFLDLISKITKHMWRTERIHPEAPHRAEYLAARKVWDVWRLAEVVVSAADGVGGGVDGVMCRDEVIGIVDAASELCGVLGDVVGRERCDDLVLSWVLNDEEGEILEFVE